MRSRENESSEFENEVDDINEIDEMDEVYDMDADEDVEELFKVDDLIFSNENSTDSFLTLVDGRKIHKKSLVYSLQHDKINIGSDTHSRFIPKKAITVSNSIHKEELLYKNDVISKGDFIILKLGNVCYFGCVLNFCFVNETSKSRSVYFNDFVDLKDEKLFHKIGVTLEPTFELKKHQKVPVNMITKPFLLKDYICHAQQDVNFLGSEVKNLLKFFL